MKLSVIVPVYNAEAFLHECVDSLLTQTLKDMEIILVDDGSRDASGNICDEYERRFPERVRVIHIDNGGQGRARNIALDYAQGEYIGFVDSDDWLDRTMYEKLCSRADDTGADIVVCDFLKKFSDGSERYEPACVQEHRLAAAGSSCNKIFRRSVIGQTRFPQGLWYEDFYFSAMLLMRSGRTEYLAQPLYIYRNGQQSTMHNNNAAKNLDMLKIMELLRPEMKELGFEEDFFFFMINHVLLDSINRIARQDAADKKEVIRRLRNYVRENIPHLKDCESFRNETKNRRIIMTLNYYGLHTVSRLILNTKQAMSKSE